MKKQTVKFTSALLALLSLVLVIPMSANAHEPRDGVAGGNYNVSVGHRSEPGFAREPNAFDLFVRNPDDTPADVEEIELDVYVLRLAEDDIDAKVRKKRKLNGDLRRDFSTPNRFNIHYMPKRAGAYGFHIKGTINNIDIDELFVCGGGSQHPNGRSFGCVDNIQRF